MKASLDTEGRLVAERLAQLVRESGGASEVSRRSGIPLRSLAKYVAGDATPSAPTVGRIARALGRSADWILGLRDAPDAAVDKPDQAEYINVPILDVHASAGAGHENGEVPVLGSWPFALQFLHRLGVVPSRARILQARGDSMFPTIVDGAPVLVDVSNREPMDGRIYALLGPDGMRIKRIQRSMDGSLILISDNRDLYQPERVPPHEVSTIKVVGRVYWTDRSL